MINLPQDNVFISGKVVPARVPVCRSESPGGAFLAPGQVEISRERNYCGNMSRQFLPRDRKLFRDNMLSRVHVNRVSECAIGSGKIQC